MKNAILAAMLGTALAMAPAPAIGQSGVSIPAPVTASTVAKTLPERLQDVSVTIKAAWSEGSGVVKTRDGVNYVWTAGHVVEGNRRTRKVIDSNGTSRTVVEFSDVSIIQSLYEGGRKVGHIEMLAEVIRYSDSQYGQDLALLRVRKSNFIRSSVEFYLGSNIPPVGTELLHVGSLHGQGGSNSVTDGIVSQPGRILSDGHVYDQTTVTAFPGSSGGGVYLKDSGLYVGMITQGAGETFNFMVPVRRMRVWAERTGILFAMDDSVPVPDAETFAKMPIEDAGRDFNASKSAAEHGGMETHTWEKRRPGVYGPKIDRRPEK